MRGRALAFAALVACASSTFSQAALAVTLDPATAEADVTRARADGEDAFCKKPDRPLSRHARDLCAMASELKDCQGFVDACAADEVRKRGEKPREPPSLKINEGLARFFAALAQIAIWLLVAAVIVAIAIPVVQAIMKARRDKKVAEAAPKIIEQASVVDAVPEIESISDAELLLRRAEDHARNGELDRATMTFLNAALRALDHRGAIRLARHRTNGEYVRGCKETPAKQPLREIVREVDKVQFGGQTPTIESVRSVAARATALVRMLPLAIMALALLLLTGCEPRDHGPIQRAADPAGDQMMMDLLKRQGMTVTRLGGSLATLPMPKKGEPSFAVVVDLERTELEDETRTHLAHWVEAGGVSILAGSVAEWPKEVGAKVKHGTSTEITVAIAEAPAEESEADEDLTRFEHAKIARASAMTMEPKANELATLKSGETYAATRTLGDGIVLCLANDDLLTNAALVRQGNAPALVALFSVVDRTHEFRVARPEDGISPPTNPVSALERAGLGLGLWHALAAACVMFLAAGIRQARPKPTPPPQRRAFTEHVEATGGLYARTKIASHALASYTRYADERLRAKMPRGMTDPAAFLASRANADPARAAEVWARATSARAGDPPRGDELVILRELSALYTSATKSD